MTAMRFVDTNVLIYAVSADEAEAEKTQRALELLENPNLADRPEDLGGVHRAQEF